MITTTMTMTRLGKPHEGTSKSIGLMTKLTTSNGMYLSVSFHLRIFHFMYIRTGSIEVFRHDTVKHISEIQEISRFD